MLKSVIYLASLHGLDEFSFMAFRCVALHLRNSFVASKRDIGIFVSFSFVQLVGLTPPPRVSNCLQRKDIQYNMGIMGGKDFTQTLALQCGAECNLRMWADKCYGPSFDARQATLIFFTQFSFLDAERLNLYLRLPSYYDQS
jgi:hypothetical protein